MFLSNTELIVLIILLIISFLISYINCQESDDIKYELCSLDTNCVECSFCEDYSQCNFYNIFCYQNKSGQFKRDEKLQYNLSIYYKKNNEINNFCNSRNISLDTLKKTFNIFESINKDLTKSYHCDYYINNIYYFDHSTDSAKINFEIKNINTGNSKIKFFLLFIYKTSKNLHFFHFTDEELRNSSFSKIIDQISDFEILLDFFSVDASESIEENLVLSISTDNPSKRLRIIYIAIIALLCFFILVIIILIFLYFFLKKKMKLEQERRIKEEQQKILAKKKLVQDFIKNDLKSQLFSEKTNFNDCETCTICCDNFIIGQSEVSITPCAHVFHHECIKKWVLEKIDNPICPNCNFHFMDYIKNPVKINIKKKENSKIKKDENNGNKITIEDKNDDIIMNNEEIINNGGDNDGDLPSSEQLRINNKSKIINNESDKSIHINEDGESDNNINVEKITSNKNNKDV